jgi:ADP-ribosyl-[dinitrogen reductase] hydrolase
VTPEERIRGCLLGGAVGDALGAPVEFDSIETIRARFGREGIADLVDGAITDDTQMTLFTAEGLIRGLVRARTKGICHAPSVVDHAYARWLASQGERSERWQYEPDGWLIGVQALHARRAPGNTCLSALRGPRMGTVEEPLNDSKGCGGVMRIAPVGLLGGDRFDLACDIAALTHGHPSGYLAAGALAEILGQILDGRSLPEALDAAEQKLRTRPGHEETLRALRAGYRGEGWVAEEALGIALHCALTAESFEHGVRLAVNHSGDSDSTGAIAGNLLGAIHGAQAIPERWLDRLELRAEIEALIADFLVCFGPDAHPDPDALWERYPGW